VFLALDFIWLGVIAKNLYKEEIGHLMAEQIRWGAAGAFYLLYVLGLLVFVVLPAKSGSQALLLGAFFGLITYATYDLTNLATLKAWPVKIVIYDLVWGAVLSCAVSIISYKIDRVWLGGS
jgi:uncharacterized membrane protein